MCVCVEECVAIEGVWLLCLRLQSGKVLCMCLPSTGVCVTE